MSLLLCKVRADNQPLQESEGHDCFEVVPKSHHQHGDNN